MYSNCWANAVQKAHVAMNRYEKRVGDQLGDDAEARSLGLGDL